MDREPLIGEIVVVTHHSDRHEIAIGEKLTVCGIDDSDDTLQGWTKTSKKASDWIPWADVEPVEFGWDYVKRHLPPKIAAILEACDGIEFISLNAAIKNQIQACAPDWQDRVEMAVGQSDAPMPSGLDAFADHDDDDDDDEDEDEDDDEEDDDDEQDEPDDHPLFGRDAEDHSAPI